MEISKGNSLCLSQTSKNVMFFVSLFFSAKLENRREEQILSRRGELVGKGVGG
jgi:hypothetical protein